MAKILVADDNSNIQKMVGLALKDEGIDVLAVGNGEAAVRKIADTKPDLVLADVFMPVRNGYEVCQYVKTDNALAHIPVILLVGAFDPLDEQEAQRVGADGVLKKPFVPPEPLISMVKSALTRAGVAFGVSASRAAELAVSKSPEIPPASSASGPQWGSVAVQEPEAESPDEEAPLRPEPLKLHGGSQPVAFGSLLETPADDEQEDAVFARPADPDMALDRDWRSKDDEEEDQESEAETAKPDWRLDGAEPSKGRDSQGADEGWRAGGFEQIKAKKSQYEEWEADQSSSANAKAAKSGAGPAAPEVPAIPQAPEGWAPGLPLSSSKGSSPETAKAANESGVASLREKAESPQIVENKPETKSREAEHTETSSWYSATSSPWDAEIERANKLASAWDSGTQASGGPSANHSAEQSGDTQALPAATVEAIREEAAQVTENAAQAAPGTAHAGEQKGNAAVPTPSIDDLVAKVLANMSQDVLQAVTREILKPAVEAMVKEELKSKKP